MAHMTLVPPDFIRQFANAMNDAGLSTDRLPVADDTIHRFYVEGDTKGKKNGWYVLYGGEYPAGAFGSWKTGEKHQWSQKDIRQLTEEERYEQERILSFVRHKREIEQQNVWREVALACQEQWQRAIAANPHHPYLLAKRVKPHGIRQQGETLLIPIHDEGDRLASLQFIWQNELGQFEKRFKSKARKAGGLHRIGELTDTVYVAEGYSTGATIHEETGCCVIVAFDRGNLEAMARRLRFKGLTENRQIIFAADNDQGTNNNPGLDAAVAAAKMIDALVVCPEFPHGVEGTDFNDLKARCPDLFDAQVTTPVTHVEPHFQLVAVGEMVAEPRPIHWLIRGFLETDSLSLLFGQPACGKSFVAIDMACCIATGTPWHGAEIKRPGTTIYLAGEGLAGMSRRFKAWEVANDVSLKDAPVYVSKCSANLYDINSAKQVCKSVEYIIEHKGCEPPKLIVIDTLARNFGPADENSTQDMNQFIKHLDQLRTQWHCCVLIVHHTGVGTQERARGNSALKAALDAEYSVTKNEDVLKITSKKMKDADEPEPKEFNLTVVELPWEDDDGEVQTSCVLEAAEAPVVGNIIQQAKNIGGKRRECLNELHKLYKEHRENLENGGRGDGIARVNYSDWRDACVGSIVKDRSNFAKIKNALQDELNLIHIEGVFVYLAEDESKNEEE